MRRWFLAAAFALSLAAAGADDKPKPADPPGQYKALRQEVDDAYSAYVKAIQERKDAKDKEATERVSKAAAEWQKTQVESAAKVLELVKKDPRAEFAADALTWAVPALRLKPDAMREAVGLLKEHHLASPKIRSAVSALQFSGLPEDVVEDFLSAVDAKNPDKATRATALMALAGQYKSRAEPYGRPAPADAAEWRKKAEGVYERVAREFGDVENYRNTTFGETAKGELFEIRNLAVGKVAPDIEGEDLDGVKFKLSDYRGKVVVLDFWGDW